MINIDRAADIMTEMHHHLGGDQGWNPRAVAVTLMNDGLLAPAPQIIRTPAELEAAWSRDPDTVLIGRTGDVVLARELVDYEMTNLTPWLPAVKVSTGSHYRACREALEGATDG